MKLKNGVTHTVKTDYYARHTRDLKRQLSATLSRDELKSLHRRRAPRHFLVLLRQLGFLGGATTGLVVLENPWFWVPLVVVQGFTMFNFTVLLHEVVHNTVFESHNARWNRLLGHLYAFPSGISASQFTRWHLDHHAELGSGDGDPKRYHLSPKINKRWYKLLYFTPALFFIYFRAARREMQTYPPELQKRIHRERNLTLLGHLTILLGVGLGAGVSVLAKVYLVPYLVVFPVAFALNRLGQHYDVDAADPAKWSTLMRGGGFWDFAYLWSNYHLEHHYFPSVPFYNLPRLNRALRPFFDAAGMQPRRYAGLVWDYLVRNKAPHTKWSG